MAIIGKIRERAGLAVSLIAGSLLLFIVGGEVIQLMDKTGGDQFVGSIAGDKIKYQDYEALVEKAKQSNEAATGQPLQEYQLQQLREEIWNKFLFEKAYKKQIEDLGIILTTEEEVDMVQGQNLHPLIVQNFGNPQTGKVDLNQIRGFLQALGQGQVRPEQKAMWENFEEMIKMDRLKTKYESLITKTNYVTKAEAERDYTAQNSKADFKYLFASYNAIPDSTVKFTMDDVNSYVEKNKQKYKVQQDNAVLQYVAFPIFPSAKDSSVFKAELERIKAEFAASKDDSAFVGGNSDVANLPNYVLADQVPQAIKDNGMKKDSVVGPVAEGTSLKFYKLSGTKQDTVKYAKASHILIQAKDKSSDTSKANAKAKAENLLKELQSGKNFEELARTNSQDGSAQKGGDLGWFSEKQMVKPFSAAVFGASGKGLVAKVVESEFGYHIIKVTETSTSTMYLVSVVEKQLDASSETREAVYQKANDLILKSKDKASFLSAAKASNVLVQRAEGIAKNSQSINGLTDIRQIIRWVFTDAEEGNVAKEAYEAKDNYVVVCLDKKRTKGYLKISEDLTKIPFESLESTYRDIVYNVRKEIKGKDLLKKINASSGTLEQIAAKLGTGAIVNTTPGLTLQSYAFAEAGYDPSAVGYAFNLNKNGQKTKAFAGEGGVMIIELVNKQAVPATKDYSMNLMNLKNNLSYGIQEKLRKLIEENSDVVDDRYRFF